MLLNRQPGGDHRTTAVRCLDHDDRMADAADDSISPWKQPWTRGLMNMHFTDNRPTVINNAFKESLVFRWIRPGQAAPEHDDRPAPKSKSGSVDLGIDPPGST